MSTFQELYERYGVLGSFRLLGDKLATRISFPQARLVRRPFYVRGKRWIQIDGGFTTGPGLRLDAFPTSSGGKVVLRIGRDVQVNDYVHIAAIESVSIGNRVLIASKVFISDHNHGSFKGEGPHESPLVPPQERVLASAPVVISDDVWIGESVAVLPGVSIGRGAIIGAMSVVTRNIPEYCIAVGSPARVVKRYNFETSAWERV